MKSKRQNRHQWSDHLGKRIQASGNQLLSLIRFNITFKLTIGYTLHIASLLVFLSGLSYLGIAFFGINHLLENLGNQSQVIDKILKVDEPARQALLSAYLESEHLKLLTLDQSGQTVKGSQAATAELLQSTETTTIVTPKLMLDLTPLVLKKKLVVSENAHIEYILISDLEPYFDFRTMVLTVGGLVLFLIVLASAAEMSRMAAQHLKPIHLMTSQVRDISSNNLNVRLNVSGTRDELKDLAITFNHMLEEIEGTYDREKQFVSDASHELRTPIAVIKGYANLLRRWGKDDPSVLVESIDAIAAEADNMQRLVEDLLFIARHEQSRMSVNLEPVDLSDLVRDIAKESELIDQEHFFTAMIKANIQVLASQEHLKQAIRIFMDNAIKYTPKGGSIHMKLEASPSTALIVIKDTGIGISEADLPHIFDRFYRADKSRTRLSEEQTAGSGLGLAIAKIIIERHGAKVYVESVLNAGTEVSILLPLFKHDTGVN